MSSNWSALHAQLVRSVNRHSNMHTFSNIFLTDLSPSGFRDPPHLFGWLHSPSGDHTIKNTVLAQLLSKACGEGAERELAAELLILALWPGLCAVRHRLRSYRDIETLDADLLSQITITIRQSDPVHVTRIAATLLRNTERDLRRAYRREAQTSRLPNEEQVRICLVVSEPASGPDVTIAAAEEALGDDGVLLTAVHIAGYSQKEAAALLGISHEAARKRCQRALARLRISIDA